MACTCIGVSMYTKISLHAFHINLYLHEFFKAFLFFDPHGHKQLHYTVHVANVDNDY